MNPAWILTLSFILFVWGGVRIYDLLSGRRLLLDLRDKARMGLRDIAAWDRHWQDNPQRCDVVVSMTTLPSRLPEIEASLKSLLYQSCAPARIRLHLPRVSRREKVGYTVPSWLHALKSVEIVECEKDHGPATKLIPALQDLPPDQRILVVDDDKLYPPDLVAHFDALSNSHPEIAIGSSGWCAPDDLTDRKVTVWGTLRGVAPGRIKATHVGSPQPVDILQGHSGFLVRPRFFDVAELLASYTEGPDLAFYADDIWLSGHSRVPKMVFPARRFCFVSWKRVGLYDRTSLGRRDAGTASQIQTNTSLIRYLRERWMNSSGSDHAR